MVIKIKFKGKSVNDGNWIESMTIAQGTIKRKRDNYYFEVNENRWVGIIPESIGQFTGRKDKNEVDIYTKDIFDVHQTINGQSKFVIMECIGGFDVRYLHDLTRKYEYDVNELLGIEELEVIGNVSDNLK